MMLHAAGAGDTVRAQSKAVPGAPTYLIAQRNTLTSVVLFWGPVSNNVQVGGYYIIRNNVVIGTTTGRVFVDKTVGIGLTYYYKITAYTQDRVYSPYSDTVRVYVAPSLGPVYWAKDNQYSGYLKGVDVSSYISGLNWQRIKSDGVGYAYVRAGNSALNKGYIPDPMAQNHTIGAKSVGLPVGFYYIPYWSNKNYNLNKAKTDAEAFARHILSLMSGAGGSGYGDLLPSLDLEPPVGQVNVGLTGKQIVDWARLFCDHFKEYTGRTVMIYANRYFFSQWNITSDINTLNNLPLWDAEYYEYNEYLKYSDDTPMSFGGWSGWVIWQFAQSVVVGGYSRMDLNWCRSLDLIMPPSAPTNLVKYNTAPGTVRFEWRKNTEIDIKGYNVYRYGVRISTTTDNFITIPGLEPGKTYEFSIQAVDIFNDVSKRVPIKVYIPLTVT